MELYSKLKGIKGQNKEEIDDILKKIDLYHKKKYRAGNLSGG